MTGATWTGQLALLRYLKGSVQVVARDPMQFPVLAVHPRFRFVPAVAQLLLEPTEGGVIVRDRVRATLARLGRCLAVAPCLNEAMAMGRRAWGRSPFLVSDGRLLEVSGSGMPSSIGATFRKRLECAAVIEPLSVLPRMTGLGETGVLENGDGVLWLNALWCLRGLAPAAARRIAWCGQADGAVVPDLHLTVPDGVVRLRFRQVRARPVLRVPPDCRVRWIDGETVEVSSGGRPPGVIEITALAPRAILSRVGLVLSADHGTEDRFMPDPLAVYSDPIGLDDFS